jgi:hypothetical protein
MRANAALVARTVRRLTHDYCSESLLKFLLKICPEEGEE